MLQIFLKFKNEALHLSKATSRLNIFAVAIEYRISMTEVLMYSLKNLKISLLYTLFN